MHQCQKCHQFARDDYIFCPHCGQRIAKKNIKKQLKKWIKSFLYIPGLFLMLFILDVLVSPKFSQTNQDSLIALSENNISANPGVMSGSAGASIDWLLPIDLQLRAFRQKDIETAYNETVSKEFKAATTLEEFIKFAEKYPILFSHHSISVKSQSFKNKEAEITILLNPESDAIPVRYLLVNEDGKWKVWSMNITPTYSEAVNQLLSDFSSMRKPVEGQLQALKNGEIPKAYHEFVAKTFKESTSQDAFRKFLNAFPVMTRYAAAEFKEPVIDKTTALIEVNLYDQFGTTIIEYTLGIENNQWKIWGIRVLEQTPEHAMAQEGEGIKEDEGKSEVSQKEQSVSSLKFDRVEVGTGLDLLGQIADPVTALKSPHGDIFVNVFVKNGIARVKVNVLLVHVESHSTLPEVSTTLQQEGDAMLSFSFTPPPSGWPKGNYEIKVNSSTGVSHIFTFAIE